MRKIGTFLMMLCAVVTFFVPATFARERGNPRESKKERVGTIVPVPEGMMAVVTPAGHDFVLLPGSPDDFTFALDGTVLAARTDQGQRILDAARNSFLAEKAAAEIFMEDLAAGGASVEAVGTKAPQLVDCDGSYECGAMIRQRTGRYSCMPNACGGCTYWQETCTAPIMP